MAEAAFANARILVIDDEESNVKTLARVLRAAGYQRVSTTTDPTEFLSLYRQQHPDLILLDLHMPKRDGLQILEDLRGISGPQTYLPVLVITADTGSRDPPRERCSPGRRTIVTKPFEVGRAAAPHRQSAGDETPPPRHPHAEPVAGAAGARAHRRAGGGVPRHPRASGDRGGVP